MTTMVEARLLCLERTGISAAGKRVWLVANGEGVLVPLSHYPATPHSTVLTADADHTRAVENVSRILSYSPFIREQGWSGW